MFLVNLLLTPYAFILLPILFYLLPYLRNRSTRNIPGPPFAAFSNLWLFYQCRKARRFQAVDHAHKRYGKFVRLQPDHISIADDQAINVVYGHGTGTMKSDFYDAFVSIHRGLFNVRDRAAHSRKRKIVSGTFAPKSVSQFEPYIDANLKAFVGQWDNIAKNAPAEEKERGHADINALHWFNYLAFDIIGDLAFGAPFGMVSKGADIAEVRSSPDAKPTFAPAVEVLNRRGEVSATIGCIPALKPFARHLPDPFFYRGIRAVENLAGIAVARVRQRLASADAGEPQRQDLLARLMEGKDENGDPLGREELTAEALTQLIAGSDTTSNSMCALLFHVLRTDGVQERLQAELDEAVGMQEDEVCEFENVKDLPYLDKVIKETLRIHSTSSLGLPRMAPPNGVHFEGRSFPVGTVLSVPSYTIHHSPDIWDPDSKTPHSSPHYSPSASLFHPDNFNPDRWDKTRLTERQKNAFIPFSYGPRACVGRNVAEMELAVITSTIFRRYEFVLRQRVDEWETREGFLRKPMGLKAGLRLRDKSPFRRVALRAFSSSPVSGLTRTSSRLRFISVCSSQPANKVSRPVLSSFIRCYSTEQEQQKELEEEEAVAEQKEEEEAIAEQKEEEAAVAEQKEEAAAVEEEQTEAENHSILQEESVLDSSAKDVPESAPDVRETVAQTEKTAGTPAADAVAGAASSDPSDPARQEPLRVDSAESPAQETQSTHNLYVGNLYFEVTAETLRETFARFGQIQDTRVVYDGRGLSKGFGYVNFFNVEDAKKAQEALDSQVLEGRRMTVQMAIKSGANKKQQHYTRPRPSAPPSRVLFIGNMSYQMSDKDLNELFRDIKNVLDVRVAIDRRTGQPRGFAHADFLDIKSAEAAREYLETKEYYGRRLRADFSSSSRNLKQGE